MSVGEDFVKDGECRDVAGWPSSASARALPVSTV